MAPARPRPAAARLAIAALAAASLVAGCQARPRPATGPLELAPADLALAKAAWAYFEAERRPTGLVGSAARFPALSMWDAGSQLAGLCAGLELGFLDRPAFDAWMAQALAALARLPLYRGELPNKVYHADTLAPLGYGDLATRREIGYSALDLGRLARWLGYVAARHPHHAAACQAVTARWKLGRLARDGAMMGTDATRGAELHYQEGRLGYEQYAAHGLARLGLDLARARDPRAHAREVMVSGVAVPADAREDAGSGAHNYVTSEPYVLDGLETGFAALPAEAATSVLLAQQARAAETGVPTAWSEDNVDRAPYFVYNCLYVNGATWRAVDAAGEPADAHRGSSLKAALAWHVLYRTPYTRAVYEGLRGLADPAKGAWAGRYEADGRPNKALTLNTNGVVLEAFLVAKTGRPIAAWAEGGGR